MIEIGQPFQAADWYEPGGKKRCRRHLELCFQRCGNVYGLRFGRIAWTDYSVEDAPAPPPPLAKQRGARLLVGETRVIGFKPQVALASESRFVDDLDRKDLLRLRGITRRAHAQSNPGKPPLTDEQCDAVINEIGPESALRTLRAH